MLQVTGVRLLLDAMAIEADLDNMQPSSQAQPQPQSQAQPLAQSQSQSQPLAQSHTSRPPIHAYARLGPSHDHQPPFCWRQFLTR